jgi:hypothetical protein
MSAVVSGETGAGQRATPAASARAPRYARPAVAGLLLLAAIAGLDAAGPGLGAGGPSHRHALLIGVVLELALAALLFALAALTRRSPEPGPLGGQLRYVLRRAAAVAMIAIAIIGIANYVAARRGKDLLRLVLGHGKPTPKERKLWRLFGHPPPSHGPSLIYLLYALIALLLLAAIAACVLVVVRRQPAWPVGYDDFAGDDDDEELGRAVESGRAALRAVNDARAAIIACYLAMEASLASAGTARTVAETPDELLARAAGSGLLAGPAAARLTALFYEARYSTHPLSGSAKDDAQAALDAISAELRGRRTPSAAAAGAAGEAPR